MNSPLLVIILLAALILALLILCFFVYGSRRDIEQLSSKHNILTENFFEQQQLLQSCIAKIEESDIHINSLRESIDPMFSRLDKIEGALREQQNQDPELKLYRQATNMAKQGVSAQEIASVCELPISEAKVLVSLHSKTV